MKISCAIFLLLLFTSNLFSQNKGYIGLSVGGGVPVGHYGNTDVSDSAAGLATTGVNFSLSFAYKISKKIGICGMLRNQSNSMNVTSAEAQFAKKYPNVSWSIIADDWNIKLFMAGIYNSVPIKDSTTFIDFKAMLGLASSTLPGFTLTGKQSGGIPVSATQSSATSGAACFAIGLGLKHNISKRLCLLIGIDYLFTKPQFDNITIVFSNGTATSIAHVSQTITVFSGTFGIGIRI